MTEETKKENTFQSASPIPVSPHDDFNWDTDKKQVISYSEKEKKELETLYEGTFATITDNQVIKGVVVAITKNEVVLNIGFKSDGLVPLSEFRDMPNLKIGDEVEVKVVQKEDINGQLVLSRKDAKLSRAWERIIDAYKTGEIITGYITNKTKGGLIVDVFGMETFLPGSQIDVKPITDYDQFVGKTMEFKVVKINEQIRNAVISHKALIESDIEAQRTAIISKMEKGQVLEGTIKNITDFGAFIDLGGVDGLLYITDISWGRINHPNEVLKLNQKINVVVLEFDDEKKRISLGLKQLTPHPWDILDESIIVGSKVKGKVVNLEEYGAFLEILPGVEGLIHVSEITWSSQQINSKDYFKLGQELEAMVVTLDKTERKMSLSLKQMTPDPWLNIQEKFPVGSKQKGVVKNITPFGVFVDFEEGIGGMIHISDLSWTKRYNHPNEFTKVGTELMIIIMDIDMENRKISLGVKQLEEDPWDTFETVFPVGSIHEATIIKKDDKGALISLPYGLEGFVPARHLKKEDGKLAESDEKINFKILEFDRNEKKIIASHTKYWEDIKNEIKQEEYDKKRSERNETKEAVKKINKRVEKQTLGDLGVFSDLKDKMAADEAKNDSPTSSEEDNKEEPKE